MFRYFAWLWNGADASQAAGAVLMRDRLLALSPQWRCVMATNTLQVFCADERRRNVIVRPLRDDAGVVLGTLFERGTDSLDDTPHLRATLGPNDTRALIDSYGESVVQRFWGSYVALVRTRQIWSVVMAPAGNLPCLIATYQGVTLLFSCVADAVALGLIRFSPAPVYIRDRVLGRPIGWENPLQGIARLHRGECVRFDIAARPHGRVRRLCWQPLDFAESTDAIEDPTVAARALRSTVRACTHALAADHEHLLLRLSGGLDSSIVAGCLRGMSSSCGITCHTYFNPDGSADVRPWARLVAQHAGYAHIECAIDPADMDLRSLMALQPSLDVVSRLEYLGRSTLERHLCAQRGASAVFTGDGGDSGLCSDSLALAVVEYLKRHGLRPRAWQLAAQVALYTHRSSWDVFARSLRRYWFGCRLRDQLDALLDVSQLLSPELLSQQSPPTTYEHPWFGERDDVPWATIRRLGRLCLPPQCYDLSIEPQDAAPEILHPLYAQPVVELLLRIPLHVHFEDGRDRGLARRAFAPDVPAPILQRVWKDRAPGFLDALIRRHRAWLRELFLDGVLVQAGLLDRVALEAALSPAPSRSTVNPAELIRHLDTELWARDWSKRAHSRPHAP